MKDFFLSLILFFIYSLIAFAQNSNIAISNNANVSDSSLKSDIEQRVSEYFQYGNLNNDYVTVTPLWTKLNTGSHSFTKSHSDSKIEVYVNSRFSGGSFTGTNGVIFQVQVDDTVTADFDNLGAIKETNTEEFLSIYAVFNNIPAGTHTVSIWCQAAPPGSASNVAVDPGGWGGKIIVKETW